MGGKTFLWMCFSSPSGAFPQHDSHSIPSNPLNFFGLGKYSLVPCLLAPAGLWSGWSIKLIFFLFSASCCGLNLCVLSRPDHLSDRFLIHISQLKRPSLFVLDSNWFCSDLQPPQPSPLFCLFFLPLNLSSLVSHFDLPYNAKLLLRI